MKKAIKKVTVFLLLFSFIFCCAGCKDETNQSIRESENSKSDSSKSNKEKSSNNKKSAGVKSGKITEYHKDNAPVRMINTGDYWYSLIGVYGNNDYKLTVSESPEDLNVVYEINDTEIWYFEANNDYAVWCEETENESKLMLYKNSDSKVTDVYTADTTDKVGILHIGLYRDYVYYIESDYENNTDSIIEYDIKNNSKESIFSTKLSENNSIMNITVKENNLTGTVLKEGKFEIILIDLDSDNTPVVTELPKNADYVYNTAYDSVNDTYAIYYADKDNKEHIGIYNQKMKECKNIVTFNDNVYANYDYIECYDGHVYWVFQVIASGNVADHYKLVDYNYIDDKIKEYERTFYFSKSNNDMYALSFDSKMYENIVLDKYEIKPEVYQA